MLEIKRFKPLTLTVLLLVLDQITKALVVAKIPLRTTAFSLFGDFFNLIHVRNLGVAFSIGVNLPPGIRTILFVIFPLLVLIFLMFYVVRTDEITQGQRWILAGIAGGGLGNLADRIFRAEGVVDFLDFKFYGLFGLDRWPAFNIADASVLTSGFLLILSVLIQEARERKLKRKQHE